MLLGKEIGGGSQNIGRDALLELEKQWKPCAGIHVQYLRD